MNDEQQAVHDALVECLDLEGSALTGWIVAYETLPPEGQATAGSMYGPEGMTTWRALGLVEWARRFCLKPDESEDADDD